MITSRANANANESNVRNRAECSLWLLAELNQAINAITNINKTAEGIDEFSHKSRYDIILFTKIQIGCRRTPERDKG